MKRQPLKTKTGCDRCKARRKKCDEKQPTCGNCIRLNLICSWHSRSGTTSSQTQNLETRTGAVDGLASSLFKRVPLSSLRMLSKIQLSAAGYVPFLDQGQFHFSTKIADTYGPLLVQTAPAELRDASVLTMATLQDECTRDAMAGFSAYVSYSMDYQNIELKHEALRLYQRGLSTIHRSLSGPNASATRIGLLLAITFLGLVESLGTGNAEAAKVHFLAAAALCRQVRPSPGWPLSQLTLYRIVVECWLFNISTTAIFYKCDDVMKHIDWSILGEAFGTAPVLDARSFRVSPHLGGNHDIYRLMLQATCLARRSHSSKNDDQEVAQLSADTDQLELQLPFYFSALPYRAAKLVHAKYQLHVFALRVILAKIRDPKISASDDEIQLLVSDAKTLLESEDMHEARNPALAWPLIILLMAADQFPTVEFFAATISDIYANFDPGHRTRLNQVISSVRWRMEQGMEALDLLLEEHGILADKNVTCQAAIEQTPTCESGEKILVSG